MLIEYILLNYEMLIFILLLLIIICGSLLLFLQSRFISETKNNIEKLSGFLKKNNIELANYLNNLSDNLENNKSNFMDLSNKINNLEKEITRMINVKGNDDMLSLAIDLARKGENKDFIKEKTGLNDDEIDTIYTYHRNLKSD